ncbi:MAG: hypothetical protein ACJ70N_04660, partial [Nitrososphaera sp.]
MRSRKKPLSYSSLSQLFASALFFIGLALTMIPPSSVIVFADDAQGTAPSDYGFITTSAAVSSIPSSIEDEDETEEDDDENDEDEDETQDEESPLRIAFVKPSFTFAAYQLNGFYNFYDKAYDQAERTANVTTDLNLLTVRVPDGPYLSYKDDPLDRPRIPSQQNYYDTLRELLEEKASSQDLEIDIVDITDKEVHEGSIFDNVGNNAYDVLFLF